MASSSSSSTSTFQYPPPVWEFVPDESLESPSTSTMTTAVQVQPRTASSYVLQESAGCLDASWQEEEEQEGDDVDDDDVRTPFKPLDGTTTTNTTNTSTDSIANINGLSFFPTTPRCWMLLFLLVALAVLVPVTVLWVAPAVSPSAQVSWTPSSQCVWGVPDLEDLEDLEDINENEEDLAVYAHLQRLLGPLLVGNQEDDCFPATFQQQQALLWLMNHWLLPQDKEELPFLPTPTTPSATTISSSKDPSMQVEWLVQAFVASLLALHWDLHHHLPTTTVTVTAAVDASTSLPVHVQTLCSWAGVLCTGDGRWRSLQWNSNSDTDYVPLQGSIPTELGLLTQLRLLDLSQQPHLTGSLPSTLTQLSHLQALYLQDNVALTGTFPTSAVVLAGASNDDEDVVLWPELTDVRIRYCPGIQQYGLSFLPTVTQDDMEEDSTSSSGRTTGTGTVTVSPRLQFLEWSQAMMTTSDDTSSDNTASPPEQEDNLSTDEPSSVLTPSFSPTLPSELGLWTNLQWVVLDGIGWGGTIPSTLSQWSKVQMLDLAYNYLEGTMPIELGQWSTLEWLSLQDSGLTGHLPSPWKDLDWSYVEVGNSGTFGGLDLEPKSVYSLLEQLSIDCKCGDEWPLMNHEGSVPPLPEKCLCSKTLDG
eukprot:Nitzschia sp. Nitz4//scaffold49_size126201//30214//32461//NITZ4_003634-RA/size126201-augustus-gene-0.9-mRNA-1//-1//CDS//3329553125//5040//frame0